MQNLNQIRAAAALALCRPPGGDPMKPPFTRPEVARLPSLIIGNGLLAAVAFAIEDGKTTRDGINHVINGAAKHLSHPAHGIASLEECKVGDDIICMLTRHSSSDTDLQRATSETLAFLSYVKRFAAKPEND